MLILQERYIEHIAEMCFITKFSFDLKWPL